MTSIGNELARKIRSPEHFTDLMTNTGKNAEENARNEVLCNFIIMKYKVHDAMEIIVENFFEEDLPCFSPKRDADSHSIFFSLDGFDFQVIKGLNYDIINLESEFGGKTFYYNPITLKVNGEKKLGMRFLDKITNLSSGHTVGTDVDICGLQRFNIKYDSACFKPAEWLYSLKNFYNNFCLLTELFQKYGKSCSEISDLFEKSEIYFKNINKNIQIDPEILREFR